MAKSVSRSGWRGGADSSLRTACTDSSRRYHFDADILGLAKTVCSLRWDSTYPGDPGAVIHKHERAPCPIAPRTPDADWIPYVAERGWLMITRDSNIQGRVAEVNAVVDNGGRMVALANQDAVTVWAQLEVLMTQWWG